MICTRIQQAEAWDPMLLEFSDPHLLQSWAWGELKAKYGWHAERWLWRNEAGTPIGAAQVLFRSVRGGLTMAYCPRGPVVDWNQPEIWQPVLIEL
ncbi:MAG: peptidoglycan bridge formation glycyltransferase FemA/FemB family protein, partial [Anaerolineales bacterium]